MKSDSSMSAGSVPPVRGVRWVLGLPWAAARALFFWDRRDIGDRQTHIMYLCLFLAMLVLPFFLSFDPAQGDQVAIGPYNIPGTCISRQVFHVSCPGCNLTRAFVLLAHGEFREAIRQHRLAMFLYAFFAGQVAFRVYCLRRRGRPIPWRLLGINHYLAVFTIALMLGNWVVGIFIGGNGS